MKTIIVLAGNREQFEYWRSSEFRPATELIYADFPEKLIGRRADELVVVGTFWDRKDAGDIYEIAQTRLNGIVK